MTKIIRLPEVKALTGLSRSTIYSFIKTGDFPKGIALGMNSVGWLEEEVLRWINQRVQKREVSNG